MPRLTRALRLLLAVALLCAQQAALAHAVWHAGKKEAQSSQQQLCAQHGALDAVGSVVHGAPPYVVPAAPQNPPYLSPSAPVAQLRGIAPVSRGPPSLS